MRNQALAFAGVLMLVCQAQGQLSRTPRALAGTPVRVAEMNVLLASPGGVASLPTSSPADACAGVESHTDANFAGGSFVAQAGFAETEVAAASYVLPPSAFPIKVKMTEGIFVTSSATIGTTTAWSVIVYAGTPQAGVQIASFSSDGDIIPHLAMPPGTNGTNIQFIIDPQDPEQIIVQDNGSHTFSVGYRIDDHNAQTGNPCLTAPPTCCNAFPATDVSGLAQPDGNWLKAVNCGPLGCPPNGGWASFSQLQPGVCRPSGDWVVRATWESVNCCYADCNEDGSLNLADFGCFQTKYASQNPYADCNADQILNLADFGCYQTKFAQGCP